MNDTEPGKTRQLFPMRRGVRLYEGLLVRLPLPENNSRCGTVVSRGMARPVMGVRWGGEACAAAQPAAGRREQAVPPAFV